VTVPPLGSFLAIKPATYSSVYGVFSGTTCAPTSRENARHSVAAAGIFELVMLVILGRLIWKCGVCWMNL
jgi:hypothetical protein